MEGGQDRGPLRDCTGVTTDERRSDDFAISLKYGKIAEVKLRRDMI